jgi:hypothetical protein
MRIYIKTVFYAKTICIFLFLLKIDVMKKFLGFLLVILFLVAASACSVCKHSEKSQTMKSGLASPQTIIYITKEDYSNLVPITLSADKKTVASYPDVKDISRAGQLTLPTRLHKNYLLDNRGIDRNVAFIKLTYAEYAALPSTPGAEELMKMVIDKDPLRTMYACGPRSKFTSIVDELNNAIDSGSLSAFDKIK